MPRVCRAQGIARGLDDTSVALIVWRERGCTFLVHVHGPDGMRLARTAHDGLTRFRGAP